MKTGDHILSTVKLPNLDVIKAHCSCGEWSLQSFPKSRIDLKFKAHFDDVTGNAPIVPEPHMFALEGE